MSTFASTRLLRELSELQRDPPPGIYGVLRDNNIMIWDVIICGPDCGPWQGGTFQLSVEFNNDYPLQPPIAKFNSKMYHPNVFEDGTICLDILGYNWSPIWSAPFLLVAIQSILCDPFVDSAANFEAARLFVTDKRAYNRKVSEIVELSWT
ncbi:Ubiquitin-conjugating enzyme E2 2 [Carex littledalei]|uniref:Ubiquitin-conjugating enzyme E2 2 n=1 Tax=Carex littledalei TaxID=544730 RepID=A0A833RC90_9POAL|nr:Ubiquitin-conjugating enzyme E2 2 [Carex littledalei]